MPPEKEPLLSIPPPDVTAGLRALIQKWRVFADEQALSTEHLAGSRLTQRDIARLRICANELEAALQSPADPSAARSATIRFWHDRASSLRDALVDITDAEECPNPMERAVEALKEHDDAFTTRERLLIEAAAFEGFIEQSRSDTLVTWVDQEERYRLIAVLLRDAAAALEGEGLPHQQKLAGSMVLEDIPDLCAPPATRGSDGETPQTDKGKG